MIKSWLGGGGADIDPVGAIIGRMGIPRVEASGYLSKKT